MRNHRDAPGLCDVCRKPRRVALGRWLPNPAAPMWLASRAEVSGLAAFAQTPQTFVNKRLSKNFFMSLCTPTTRMCKWAAVRAFVLHKEKISVTAYCRL